ncbi:hypothetical protein GQ457_04G006020 [Hibiscus cannabinus]
MKRHSENQGGLLQQEATSSVHTNLRRNSSPEEEGETVAMDSQQFVQPEPMMMSRTNKTIESNESAAVESAEYAAIESTEPAFEPALPEDDEAGLVAEEPEVSIEPQQTTHDNMEQVRNEAGLLDEGQRQSELNQQHVHSRSHAMVTRSRNGIFKPKLYAVSVPEGSIAEPVDVHEALEIPQWREAVMDEFRALQRNNTWSLVELPEGRSTVGCKWLFKVKQNSDGIVQRYKARLVARVTHNWVLRQVDVNNAFLNGDLEEEVFMKQPPGFEEYATDGTPLVCKLNRSLYGLKQTPRSWNCKLKAALFQFGFKESRADSSLFLLTKNGKRVFCWSKPKDQSLDD